MKYNQLEKERVGKRKVCLPIGSHVDMIFFGHEGNLFGVEASEGKHSNLLDYVTPVTRCTCQNKLKITIHFELLLLSFHYFQP